MSSNGAADGTCNELLPNDSIYKRFLYVVSTLAHNGFYIVVDNHLSYDTTYQNQGQWTALWAQVRLQELALDQLFNMLAKCMAKQPWEGLYHAHFLAGPCHIVIWRSA